MSGEESAIPCIVGSDWLLQFLNPGPFVHRPCLTLYQRLGCQGYIRTICIHSHYRLANTRPKGSVLHGALDLSPVSAFPSLRCTLLEVEQCPSTYQGEMDEPPNSFREKSFQFRKEEHRPEGGLLGSFSRSPEEQPCVRKHRGLYHSKRSTHEFAHVLGGTRIYPRQG
ncbi:hypothetical protein BP00DRAFT_22913 [Aspergillus indologenus CBS 114.80]|uniref:Uncharacterized protein n=1 Tax=Aspergillus indologenus CBS 114.80 TaxID=1450541 RepID=A0A2V5HZ68_9EURO|nr:hypothetical protein BP00DRAFT_22913 [Aspergillus indologenus CBS 114.80]